MTDSTNNQSKETTEAVATVKLNNAINNEIYNHRNANYLKKQKKIKFASTALSATAATAALLGMMENPKSGDINLLATTAITLNLAASALGRHHKREEAKIIKETTTRHGQDQKFKNISMDPLNDSSAFKSTEKTTDHRLTQFETLATIAMIGGGMFSSLNTVLISGALAKAFSMAKDARLGNTTVKMKVALGPAMPATIRNPKSNERD